MPVAVGASSGWAIGIVLGVLMAVMRLSPNPVVSGFSWLYIWFFRGTPLLVQLLFWEFGAALFQNISLGVPFGGPAIVTLHYNSLVTAFVAALLGFGLNEGAYMAEIVRAGMISVDEGQTQAAQSLGMSRLQTLRLIVLPQAMRVIIPPLTNQYLNLTKNSSLAVFVGYPDLVQIFTGTVLNQTGQAVEVVMITMAVYLSISLVTSMAMNWYNARIALVER